MTFRSAITTAAMVAAQRLGGTLAEVPTLREQGIDVVVASWRTVFGARNMTPAQIAYWEAVLARHLEESYGVTRSVMAELGLAK